MKKYKVLTIVLGLLICHSSSVHADSLFGDFQRVPNEIEKGLTLGADFGLMFLTGPTSGDAPIVLPGQTAANPGFQLSFNLGYDIMKYLSIEGISTIGIAQADTTDPLLTGGVNLFFFDVAAKLQYPLHRWNPFITIGSGLTYTAPEFVANQNWKTNLLMSGGMEYYTYLRHFSLYGKMTYYYVVDLPNNAMMFSGGIKYTF